MSEQFHQNSMKDFQKERFGPKTRQIPESWDVGRLGNTTYLKGRIGWHGLTEEDHLYDGEYYLVTGTDFEDGRVQWDRCVYVNEDWYERDPNIQLEEKDILVTKDGSIGKIAFVDKLPGQATLNNGLFVLRPLKKEYDPKFMYYILKSFYFDDFVETITAGSTISHLYQKDFKNFRFPLPSFSEQCRIVNIISEVDEYIGQTDKIIEKQKELRQGLLQELFHRGAVEHERILDPEELVNKAGGVNTGMDQMTVGQIPEGWETERLGGLTENSAYGVNASAEEFDPEKPRYLRITDIADDGHLKQDDPKSISRDVSEGYELKPGDLVFARTGATVGKTLLYQESHPEAAYAGYLIRFQLNQSRILPKFAFYFTQTDNYDRWVSRITRQGAQENINTGEYCSILLPLPPITEQQKIVSILETVDQNIEQERKTKKSLQELKRGLMQDLLTGTVRVDPEQAN